MAVWDFNDFLNCDDRREDDPRPTALQGMACWESVRLAQADAFDELIIDVTTTPVDIIMSEL